MGVSDIIHEVFQNYTHMISRTNQAMSYYVLFPMDSSQAHVSIFLGITNGF